MGMEIVVEGASISRKGWWSTALSTSLPTIYSIGKIVLVLDSTEWTIVSVGVSVQTRLCILASEAVWERSDWKTWPSPCLSTFKISF